MSCQASSLTAERDSLGQQLRGMRADVDRLGAERDSWMRQAREAVAALRAVPAPTLPPPPPPSACSGIQTEPDRCHEEAVAQVRGL